MQSVNEAKIVKSPDILTPDQEDAIDRLYGFNSTFLIARMGAGKTVIALSAIEELLRGGFLKHVLIIAPLKVCNTVWKQEAASWGHLKHLDIGICTGSEADRANVLLEQHSITVINFENVVWLFEMFGASKQGHFFDGLLVDELSRLKASGGRVFKKLRRRLDDFTWRVGMTGTPVSEDWIGLFGQMLIVDGGRALGTRRDRFLNAYFYPTDYKQYNWELREGSAAVLTHLIADAVHTMPDYTHTLPPLNEYDYVIELPDSARGVYKNMCKNMIVKLENAEVVAENAAVLSGKLLQLASGFLYVEDRPSVRIHDEKIKAVKALLTDSPTIVCYWFKDELARLRKAFPDAEVLGGGVSKKETDRIVDAWTRGDVKVLLLHPRSAGHGLNLAAGGHRMIWTGPVWSRDLSEQTAARLWRRGQRHAVDVTTIIVKDTIDELVVERLNDKGGYHRLLMAHLKSAG